MLLTPELNLLAKLVKDFIILDGSCDRRRDLTEDEVVNPLDLFFGDLLTWEGASLILVPGIHKPLDVIREDGEVFE